MQKEDFLAKLKPHLAELSEHFGVEALYLFGSMAREEGAPESDADFLVRFSAHPGFMGYMNLKLFLEDILGLPVDLVLESALRPEMRPNVEREALRVA